MIKEAESPKLRLQVFNAARAENVNLNHQHPIGRKQCKKIEKKRKEKSNPIPCEI
jgi:hypothetical protein